MHNPLKGLIDVVHGDVKEQPHQSCVGPLRLESSRGIDEHLPAPGLLFPDTGHQSPHKRTQTQAEVRLPVREVPDAHHPRLVPPVFKELGKSPGTEVTFRGFGVEEHQCVVFPEQMTQRVRLRRGLSQVREGKEPDEFCHVRGTGRRCIPHKGSPHRIQNGPHQVSPLSIPGSIIPSIEKGPELPGKRTQPL